jgi:nitroimidazol reductase NimA-like FMN-containing flavoprotein (pyridoxamine 5'-phosphate oxidase superfamily)
MLPNPGSTDRTTVHRLGDRAVADRAEMYQILDSIAICHIGYVEDGQPFVLPYAYARHEDSLLIHGSTGARFMRAMAAGASVCVTVTKLDGLVLARSTFDSSMNYRSVVVLGVAEEVTGDEKAQLLDVLSDGLVPGRVAEVRKSTKKELAATTLLRLSLAEASVKVRSGQVDEDRAGYDSDEDFDAVWAGVIPLRTIADVPLPADSAAESVPLPQSVLNYLENPKA